MRVRFLAGTVVTVVVLAIAPAAIADPIDDSEPLRDGVTLEGIEEHMEKLQTLADAHQGNRAAGTVGYEASKDYVADRLEEAGYDVDLKSFDFPDWQENSPAVLEQISPTPTTYIYGTAADSGSDAVDFITAQFSGAGNVTAPVIPTNDVQVPPGAEPNSSNSGCEPGDFPPATDGAISLIQRGECPFVDKFANAADAGAAGVILFNEGQADPPGRQNPLLVGAEPYFEVPAVFASFAVGEELYNAFEAGDAPQVRLDVDATTRSRVQHNVIANSSWGDRGNKVVVGGHLDSVGAGPGINDNGSGTMTIVETAEQIAELKASRDAAVSEARSDVRSARRDVNRAERKKDRAKRKLKRANRKVGKAKRKLRRADDGKAERKAKRKLRKARNQKQRKRDRVRKARQQLREATQARTEARDELVAARQIFRPRQQLRLAFWGAEEAGLIGSTQYVAQLTARERERIMLNLNFDMLGSPNFARLVYDGNTDETPPPPGGSPPGSDVIEEVFLDYFESQELPTQPTAFDGRSDYGPFIAQGIPAGGLFSGAEQPKTAEQVELFGGVEGEQLDPCYHEECDTFDSVFGDGPPGLPELAGNGATSLDQMADAVAHSTHYFLTQQDPLGATASASQAKQKLRPYRLPFKGSELATR